MILAADKLTLVWDHDEDIEYVNGPLDAVGTYEILDLGKHSMTMSLAMSGDPAPNEGSYYLVKLPTPCGSWQTTLGAEPQRDATLP
jgi:hypothetical protein